MLTQILDTSAIDMNDPQVKSGLEIDLRRMSAMEHDVPKGADSYLVTVTPNPVTYYPGMYRFMFKIQYGVMADGEFEPIGEPIDRSTERLPLI